MGSSYDFPNSNLTLHTMTAGRPSELTDELTLKIRALVLDSVSYKDIQEALDISSNTWDTWVYKNYKDFRTNLNRWKRERIIKKAEVEIESLIGYEDKRVSLNASTFALETLGKDDGYSKRNELTGKDGAPLLSSVRELPNEELERLATGSEAGIS